MILLCIYCLEYIEQMYFVDLKKHTFCVCEGREYVILVLDSTFQYLNITSHFKFFKWNLS